MPRPIPRPAAVAAVTLLLLTAAPLALLPAATADHDRTLRGTYEVGAVGDVFVLGCATGSTTGDCDPTGLTQDDSIDLGGIGIPADQLSGYTTVSASIVDDLWGAGAVGGWLCTDDDGNGEACESDRGEVREIFCGDSPTVALPASFDALFVFIDGPLNQPFDCSPLGPPTATSGGVLTSDGGVYLALGH